MVDAIEVWVVQAEAGQSPARVRLLLPAASTIADAVAASGLAASPGEAAGDVKFGVWGKRQPPGTLLRAGDRVEIYRPLVVDPKLARQQRAVKQRLQRQR